MTAPRSMTPNADSLRALRIEKALSQRELARIAGVRPGTLNRVEKGLPTRLATIAAIANALGVEPLRIASVDA